MGQLSKSWLLAGFFVLGFPSLLEDVKMWSVWMGEAAWWNYLFLMMGVILLGHTIFQGKLRDFNIDDLFRRLFRWPGLVCRIQK